VFLHQDRSVPGPVLVLILLYACATVAGDNPAKVRDNGAAAGTSTRRKLHSVFNILSGEIRKKSQADRNAVDEVDGNTIYHICYSLDQYCSNGFNPLKNAKERFEKRRSLGRYRLLIVQTAE